LRPAAAAAAGLAWGSGQQQQQAYASLPTTVILATGVQHSTALLQP